MQQALRHLKKADPVMKSIIDRIGAYEPMTRDPTFETLSRSITFQQLSGKAAGTIFARLKDTVGRRFTPAALLGLTEEQLRACGLSRQKVASLRDLAEHVVRKEINFRKLAVMEDQRIIDQLSQVRGVGVWTAQMFLIFALERPNVLPIGDLGVRNAVRKAYELDAMPQPAEVTVLGEKWYLWRSLDGLATI